MNQLREKRIKQRNIGNVNGRKYSNFFIITLLAITTLIFTRVYTSLRDNNERGALAYVELLNFGLPIVENQVYDEGSYAENRVSLEYVIIESLGLNNITTEKILNSELSLLNSFSYTNNKINPINFSAYELDQSNISKIQLNNSTFANQIYNSKIKKQLDESKPEVLIYHTHSHENYAENEPDSINENTNVVGVGDVLSKELEEKYGICVIHDKTDHCISYDESYSRSGETVDKYLNKYGDFKLVIDLHRDSIDDRSAMTTTINGVNAARITFVNAQNSTRYEKNKEITEKIFNKTKELFPTLPREIFVYPRGKNAFNQSKSDNSTLFEIGSQCNTPQESQITAECMARVIAEILNKK